MTLSATFRTAMVRGIDIFPVKVQANIDGGKPPSFSISGLSEAAFRETRVRVQAAIQNSGFLFPSGKIEVSLRRPQEGNVDGTGLDLPVALAVLDASGQLPVWTSDLFSFAELSLAGGCRPCRGAILLAKAAQGRALICATENSAEASISSEKVAGVRNLLEAARMDPARVPTVKPPPFHALRSHVDAIEMKDVRGQKKAKRALEVAAVGGFNVLIVGNLGSGRTMLARRFAHILPLMSQEEAWMTTAIHSVAGLTIGTPGLIEHRPFRAPHHSTTAAGLVGGGTGNPRPGEISLAHNGILFLDEAPEFQKQAIGYLVDAMREGEVSLMRSTGTVRFPAQAQLIVSMQFCPCGRYGTPRCACTPATIQRHQERAKPLIDLCEIKVKLEMEDVSRPYDRELDGDDTSTIQVRVERARLFQATDLETGRRSRMEKIARAIADLDEASEVQPQHRDEALSLSHI